MSRQKISILVISRKKYGAESPSASRINRLLICRPLKHKPIIRRDYWVGATATWENPLTLQTVHADLQSVDPKAIAFNKDLNDMQQVAPTYLAWKGQQAA